MSRGGDVNVKFGADTSALEKGVGEASDMLEGWAHGAHSAHRAATFFAEGIQAITGAAGGASGAVSSLIGGFAMGGPAGLAIGAVNALFEALKDVRKESEKEGEAKELTKIAEEARKASAEVEKAAYLKAHKGSSADWDAMQAAGPAEVRRTAIAAELDALAAKRATVQAAHDNAERLGYQEDALAKEAELRKLDAKKARLENEAHEQEQNIATMKGGAAVKNSEAAEKAEEDRRKETERARKQALAEHEREAAQSAQRVERLQQEIAQADAQGVSKETALQVQHAEKIRKLNEELAEAKARGFTAEVAMVERALGAEVAAYDRQAKELAQREGDAQKARDRAKLAEELKTAIAVRDMWAQIVDEESRLEDKAQKKREHQTREYMQTVGHAVSQTVTDLASGSKNMAQALTSAAESIFSGLMNNMIQMGVEWVTQQVVTSSATKATNASLIASASALAAAQAYVDALQMGLPGLVAAPIASAEAGAYVMSLAPLASAAGGWDVPWNVDPVAQLHGGEKVIPARYSQALDSLAAGGSTTIHYSPQVQALDGPSVKRVLRSHMTDLLDVLGEAKRNKRT